MPLSGFYSGKEVNGKGKPQRRRGGRRQKEKREETKGKGTEGREAGRPKRQGRQKGSNRLKLQEFLSLSLSPVQKGEGQRKGNNNKGAETEETEKRQKKRKVAPDT